jgi:hypothetical protein
MEISRSPARAQHNSRGQRPAFGSLKSALLYGLALVLALVSAGTGYAQGGGDSVVAPLLWKVDPLGQGTTLPTSCSSNDDRNGSLLIGDPLLDRPGTPGWVADVELGIVSPHVMNRLFETVTRTSGASSVVQLPSAQIDTTVMPRFEFGYQFGQAAGQLLVSYRFLDGQATNFASAGVVPAFGPGGVPVTSRLSLNTADLDYGSVEPLTVLGVEMKWRVGVRMLLEFNDSQANNGTLAQTTSNHYLGFGPHAMVDFRRPIADTGLSLFGRVEMAMVFGGLDQIYTESLTAGGVVDSGLTHDSNYGQVTSLAIQAGLTWTPQSHPNFHVTAGYLFEHFWDLGTAATGNAAREELDLQGGFLRAEWRY